jgi:hypothetical protein
VSVDECALCLLSAVGHGIRVLELLCLDSGPWTRAFSQRLGPGRTTRGRIALRLSLSAPESLDPDFLPDSLLQDSLDPDFLPDSLLQDSPGLSAPGLSAPGLSRTLPLSAPGLSRTLPSCTAAPDFACTELGRRNGITAG